MFTSTAAAPPSASAVRIKHLGCCDYADSFQRMRAFTDARNATTADELWILEHPPVFTQGQAGKAEHLLCPGNIPVVQSDRGGQVTYHGPGQAVVYVLVDLRRYGIGIRTLVQMLEQAMIDTLAAHAVDAFARREAPGVYVKRAFAAAPEEMRKIGSLGLRVRRGCSYHGLALNVAMDLTPFDRINPCGYKDLHMTQLKDLSPAGSSSRDAQAVGAQIAEHLRDALMQCPHRRAL